MQGKKIQDFFYVAVSHLQKNFMELTRLGLLAGNPQEGGQLSAQLGGLVTSFNGSVKAMDIFRSATGSSHP